MKLNKLFERMKRDQKSAISPIIATLLLILIAIAAGVVVYAYVIGFVGQTSTNQGTGTSSLEIDTATGSHTGSLTAFVRNIGGSTATITAFYVLDTTGSIVAGGSFIGTVATSSAATCSTISTTGGMACTLAAGSVVQINVANGITMTTGNTYQIKVTTSDGSSVLYTFKAS